LAAIIIIIIGGGGGGGGGGGDVALTIVSCHLLGCDAVLFGRWIPMFWRNLQPLSSW
jgi:hypothetical protein